MARKKVTDEHNWQQSLDFGSESTQSAPEPKKSIEAALELLGSSGTSTDAQVDAARMRSHLACTMAQRRTGRMIDKAIEHGLALLMLGVTQALADGSLCIGKDKFKSADETFREVMTHRRLEAQDRSDALAEPWDFEALVARLTDLGFIGAPGAAHGQGAFADGPALLVAETADGQTYVYTQKSYAQEETLGVYLAELARDTVPVAPVDPSHEAERAAQIALANRLTVISGGPGTGKTTAVVNILKGLIEQKPEALILLAAPTGKAASRMKEAVAGGAERIDQPHVRARLEQLQAKTLHRLLYTPGADGRAPSKSNPLDADIVVIDESSMIEIGLAGDFFERIDPDRTKVILLGDRFQLAAVGPGSFFADVSEQGGALKDNISHLTRSWRFDGSKALGAVAQAARAGNVRAVLEAFRNNGANEAARNNRLCLHEQPLAGELTDAFRQWLRNELEAPLSVIRGLRQNRSTQMAADAARKLAELYFSIGVLAANRQGPMSAQAVNSYAEELFIEQDIPYPAFRPMIVRRNDPMLEVYNGDTGVVMPGAEWFDGEPFDATHAEVYFPETQRRVRFGLIGHIESAFAITIHQSQGSEYHHVAVLMPLESGSALASRELFYTAVTRVRDQKSDRGVVYGSLDVFSSAEVVAKAVSSPVRRQGGLARRIREACAAPGSRD